MKMAQLIQTLGRNDIKLIRRDRFLIFMFLFVVYIALALRFGLPWANTYLSEHGILPSETISQSLSEFYPLIIGYLAVFQGAVISGTIFGFAFLDEKDDNTIKAMLVTPVPLKQYLSYRVAVPAVLAFFIVLIEVLFIGQALPSLWQLLLISFGAAFTAAIGTLFYANFAANKVQGFAYAKFLGIAGWIILLGWFVSEPFQWVFGLFPPFLICKAYWMVLEGNAFWGPTLLAGIVLQIGMIALLIKYFYKVAYR